MSRLICVICISLALAGCNRTWVWDKPGVTAAALKNDEAQCMYEVKRTVDTTSTNAGFSEAIRAAELGTLCMKARGYEKRTVEN
jgi:hypothetical protein